jgi:preprotein translocase subunit SecD
VARRRRPARTLLGFFIGLAVAYGLVALTGTWTPTLGLDLQGGTRITLIAEGSPSEDNLTEASQIIDQRVNGSGVSEAEVTTQGNQFVVVEVPGPTRRDLVDTVERQAQLRFRVVACSSVDGRCGGTAPTTPTDPTDPSAEPSPPRSPPSRPPTAAPAIRWSGWTVPTPPRSRRSRTTSARPRARRPWSRTTRTSRW